MKALLFATLALSPLCAMAQPVVTVTATPPAIPAPIVPGVRVAIAPPVLRTEVATPAPTPQHQWVPGYWAWRGNRHMWMAGHWMLPPGPGYAWAPARWENQGGGWIFYEGHWRATAPAVSTYVYQPPVREEVVEIEPPPPIQEVRPPLPFSGAVWIPGYWHWNGTRHVWLAGRWSAPMAGASWEPYHWEHRPDGRWVGHPGHWHRADEREHEHWHGHGHGRGPWHR